MPNDLQKRIEQLEKDIQALNDEFYLNNFTASQDFNKYSRFNTRLKVPTVSAVSTTCEIGEVCVVAGSGKAYVCSSANTWTVIGSQS